MFDWGQFANVYYWTTPDGWFTGAIIVGVMAFFGGLLWTVDNLFAPIAVIAHGIVGFFGKRGSGKSFVMTTYARRWRHFNRNKPVFTNMEKLVLPGNNDPCTCHHECVHNMLSSIFHDCDKLAKEDEWHDLKNHDDCRYIIGKCKAVHTDCSFAKMKACRDGLICIDEAGIFISNLNFGNRANREFARWLVATRHYKVMVLLTAHTPGTTNNRLRDVLDQLVEMSAFTTLKLFRGYVYDSGKVYGMPEKRSHTIWIPMLWTTSRSYNTDSLRLKADAENKDIVGEDFDLPWDSDGDSSTAIRPQTTTNRVNGVLSHNGSNGYVADPSHSRPAQIANGANSVTVSTLDLAALDLAFINSLARDAAKSWNGRDATDKPRGKVIRTRPATTSSIRK